MRNLLLCRAKRGKMVSLVKYIILAIIIPITEALIETVIFSKKENLCKFSQIG